MTTLRDRFRAEADLKVRQRAGGYEEWLETEVRWYRDRADALAQALAGLGDWAKGHDEPGPDVVALLERYRDERNAKDFD